MDYHIVLLKAGLATTTVIESHWTLVHIDGEHVATRYGVAMISESSQLRYAADLTEAQAIEATKAALGPEYIANLEQNVLDEIERLKNPTTIQGVPWAQPAPPPAPAPAPLP